MKPIEINDIMFCGFEYPFKPAQSMPAKQAFRNPFAQTMTELPPTTRRAAPRRAHIRYLHVCATPLCGLLLSALMGTTTLTAQAQAQAPARMAAGSYRLEGQCSRAFYLGVVAPPQCGTFMGVKVEAKGGPQFIFPLKDGGRAWFFVTSGRVEGTADRTLYTVEKVYDQALNAEFSYPAGECEILPGPSVRCSVWKDTERNTLGRELVFTGAGPWLYRP